MRRGSRGAGDRKLPGRESEERRRICIILKGNDRDCGKQGGETRRGIIEAKKGGKKKGNERKRSKGIHTISYVSTWKVFSKMTVQWGTIDSKIFRK